jgi:polyhydroxybutyrate depolymerase
VNKIVIVVSLLGLAACGGDDGGPAPLPSRVYGGDRPVELQIPTDYDASRTYPLVVLLHGYSASGFVQTAFLQLADLPTDPGAFFLAPDGTIDSQGKRFWNAHAACCNFDGSDVDDIGYIGGLIEDVSADWSVDPSRVTIIGHSNGAFMAYRMACDRADLITAIVGLAGSAPNADGSDCDPSQPVSLLHIHGTADTEIPYDGSTTASFAFPGAVGSVTQWADKIGCDPTFTDGAPIDLDRNLAGAETTVRTAECPADRAVELWTIEGGVHLPDFVPGIGTTLADWLIDHPRPAS